MATTPPATLTYGLCRPLKICSPASTRPKRPCAAKTPSASAFPPRFARARYPYPGPRGSDFWMSAITPDPVALRWPQTLALVWGASATLTPANTSARLSPPVRAFEALTNAFSLGVRPMPATIEVRPNDGPWWGFARTSCSDRLTREVTRTPSVAPASNCGRSSSRVGDSMV